ncbi:MAG: hypothetical protein R2728_09295 [Chitinophagales bacterium]
MRITLKTVLISTLLVLFQLHSITAFSLTNSNHSSEIECEYEIKKQDQFTNKIILETKNVRFHNKWERIDMSMRRVGENRFLNINLVLTIKGAFCLNEKSKILFLSSNDSTIELSPIIEFLECGNFKSTQFGSYTNYKLIFSIDETIISSLIDKEIIAIRIYGTDSYYDIDNFGGPRDKSKIPTFFEDHWNCINKKP